MMPVSVQLTRAMPVAMRGDDAVDRPVDAAAALMRGRVVRVSERS